MPTYLYNVISYVEVAVHLLYSNRAVTSTEATNTARVISIKTQGSVQPKSQQATPVSILTGRKKTRFSHLRSSVLPLRNNTNFAVDTTANFSTPHSKFERNRFKRFRDMRLQNLA